MFADGITTGKIVASLLAFSGLAGSLLVKKRVPEYILTFLCVTAVLGAGRERWRMFTCVVLLVLSALICVYTDQILELKKRLNEMQDSGTELALSLRKKNELLIENQDNRVRLATLNERTRIAREIHDNVGHMLSRALIMVGAIRTVNQAEPLEQPLEQLEKTLDEAMTEVRSSVHDLHEDGIDLKENVNEIVAGLHGYQVQVDYDCQGELDRNVKLTLIAILREAVSNITRHSSGDRVQIVLHEQPGFLTLSVADNGRPSPEDIRKADTGIDAGIGITNMRERAEALGGHVSIFSENGFRVFVNLPKKRRETG